MAEALTQRIGPGLLRACGVRIIMAAPGIATCLATFGASLIGGAS